MSNEYGMTEHADEVLARFSHLSAKGRESGIEQESLVAHAFTMGLRVGIAEPRTAREIIQKTNQGGNMDEQERFVLNGPVTR